MEIQVSLATAADAPKIAELVNAAYRGESGQKGWTTEAHLLSGLRTDEARVVDLITENASVVLKAESRAESVLEGCVHLKRTDERTAYLGMLTTSATRQTRVTGSLLLARAATYVPAACSRRCQAVDDSSVNGRCRARKLHRRANFRRLPKRPVARSCREADAVGPQLANGEGSVRAG